MWAPWNHGKSVHIRGCWHLRYVFMIKRPGNCVHIRKWSYFGVFNMRCSTVYLKGDIWNYSHLWAVRQRGHVSTAWRRFAGIHGLWFSSFCCHRNESGRADLWRAWSVVCWHVSDSSCGLTRQGQERTRARWLRTSTSLSLLSLSHAYQASLEFPFLDLTVIFHS